MAGFPYFGPEHSGVRWLLDPSAPGLAGLARAVQARTADTGCAYRAVAADLCILPIELVGLPVQAELDPVAPLSAVARGFDRLYQASGGGRGALPGE